MTVLQDRPDPILNPGQWEENKEQIAKSLQSYAPPAFSSICSGYADWLVDTKFFVVVELRDLAAIDDCYATVKCQVRSSLGETFVQIQVGTY